MGSLLIVTLICLLGYIVIPRLVSHDKSRIWNPLVFWAIYFAYYVVKPCLGDQRLWGTDWSEAAPYYAGGALLSLISILLGYRISIRKRFFKKFDKQFNNVNLLKIGILLCLTGLVCYGVFNGFSLNLFAEKKDATSFNEGGSYNNPTEYITNLMSLFSLGVSLLLANRTKSKKALIFFLVFAVIGLIFYTVVGFRYRILIMAVMLIVSFYLYPKPKRINWLVIAPLAITLYIGMGVIERTRSYGRGLDLEAIGDNDITEIEASEGDIVAVLSANCIKDYTVDEFIFFEPIYTAACMPIPRAIFPWKPDGYYMRDANMKVFHTIEIGAAMVMFAEAYISFGWLGIIFQGLFIGFVCRIFWDNYRRHRDSIGAITLLAAFNGFSFVWFSRGYLAQDFVTFMYFVIIPYWIAGFFCRKIR